GHQRPQGNLAPRAADAGDRLMPRKLHRDEVDSGDSEDPRQKIFGRGATPQVRRHHQGGDDVGGSEEGCELGARDQLDVAQRRAFGFGTARGETRRLPAGKPRRNQALITIWSLVHPPAVPPEPRAVDEERLRAVKADHFPPCGRSSWGGGSPKGWRRG